MLPDLNKESLHYLVITIFGDNLAIVNYGKLRLSVTQPPQGIPPTQALIDLQKFIKAPAAQLPYVSAEMTLPQFRKF